MSKQLKIILIVATILVSVSGGAAWIYYTHVPNPRNQSAKDVSAFLASDRFSRLGKDQKKAYLDAARQSGKMERRNDLTEEQREALFRNISPLMQDRMNQQMTEYFALAPNQRVAYLDKVIDDMQKRPTSRPTSQPGSRPSNPRGFNADRMRNRIETTDSTTRAQRDQFMKDLHNRMKQRGIDPPHSRHR